MILSGGSFLCVLFALFHQGLGILSRLLATDFGSVAGNAPKLRFPGGLLLHGRPC